MEKIAILLAFSVMCCDGSKKFDSASKKSENKPAISAPAPETANRSSADSQLAEKTPEPAAEKSMPSPESLGIQEFRKICKIGSTAIAGATLPSEFFSNTNDNRGCAHGLSSLSYLREKGCISDSAQYESLNSKEACLQFCEENNAKAHLDNPLAVCAFDGQLLWVRDATVADK